MFSIFFRPCLIIAATSLLATANTVLGEPGASDRSPASVYRFEKVSENVYCAIGTGIIDVGCNSGVIVTSNGVVVVDSGTSPVAAHALIAELRTITNQPVRYLVNTHFHYDHTFGNQAFPKEVRLVSHVFTKEVLAGDPLHERAFLAYQDTLEKRVATLTASVAGESDSSKKNNLQAQLTKAEAERQAVVGVVPRIPDDTFTDHMSLNVGETEIQLLHCGRGHTAGDIIVYLPHERLVCTGDFYNGYIGYCGDAFVNEWPDSLDRLAALDWDTIIPGHGDPFPGRSKISQVQACLREVWRQAIELNRKAASVEEAARQIDLRPFASQFPQFKSQGFSKAAVARMYQLMTEPVSHRADLTVPSNPPTTNHENHPKQGNNQLTK